MSAPPPQQQQQQQQRRPVAAPAVAQLCFGAQPTELNLRQVQRRVADLAAVVESLLGEMQRSGAHWAQFLDKVAVINAAHAQVLAELRPLLRQYAAFPKFVDSAAVEASLPEMLASRLLPEQVEQEDAWRAALPGGYAGLAAQPGAALAHADTQVVALQDAVAWLTVLGHAPPRDVRGAGAGGGSQQQQQQQQDGGGGGDGDLPPGGVLDPRGPARQAVEAASRQIAAAVEAAVAARERVGSALALNRGGGAAAAAGGVGQKRQRPGQPPQQQQQELSPEAAKDAAKDALIARLVSGALWPAMR